jgi:kinesin family protein C2/C3
MVQELKGNIRVFCRVRPLNHLDAKRGTLTAGAYANSEDRTIRVDNKGKISEFEFDRVFGEKTTQEEVFADTIPLIQSCMDGYNVCIFAYGQTGSGKTWTMEGNAENKGVNFRALTELFRVKEERKGDYSYQISVSMMEVYNETIRDLLDVSLVYHSYAYIPFVLYVFSCLLCDGYQ